MPDNRNSSILSAFAVDWDYIFDAMANERGLGRGIIRLSGSAIDRPRDNSLRGSLTPAAIELMTGVRMVSAGVFVKPSPDKKNSSNTAAEAPVSHNRPPLLNLADDWWGE